MRKLLIATLITLLCNSCLHEITLYDLQKESLKSGIRHTKIIPGFDFGMNEKDVISQLKYGKLYTFDVDIIRRIEWHVQTNYYNDSLYMISFMSLEKNRLSDILKIYTAKYKEPIYRDKSTYGNSHYWLKDNLMINIFESEYALHITYKDISREITGSGIIRDELDLLNVYTKDYFPRRENRRILDGI